MPASTPSHSDHASGSSSAGAVPPVAKSVLPWTAPTPQVMANRLRKAASASDLTRRVEEIGARLSAPTARRPAAERLADLRARVRARLPCSAVCPNFLACGLCDGSRNLSYDAAIGPAHRKKVFMVYYRLKIAN